MAIQREMIVPVSHKSLFHQHQSTLSHHDIKHVNDYLNMGLRQFPPHSSGSVRINTHLIGAAKANMHPNPHIRFSNGETFDLYGMDHALSKTTLPEMKTYSGISFNPSNLTSNGHIVFPPFISTSTRRFTAGKYAIQHSDENGHHHILEIHHPEGSKGLYVGNQTHLSEYSDDEVILPRNERMKISSTPMLSLVHNNHTFHVWSATRTNGVHED